ncbi:MAG: leucyl aminopeptidase family protein [Deltaproteobacteria bacterium]|nr:MAG: leucyl aminopeptidase family protein [Deltaproteobacteria bacterium]
MDGFAPRPTAKTVPVDVVDAAAAKAFVRKLPASARAVLAAQGFEPKPGRATVLPGSGGKARVLLVRRGPGDVWSAGALARLGSGRYAVRTRLAPEDATAFALGFALGRYRFERYLAPKRRPTLVWPEGADRARVHAEAEAIRLGRDLINTPAADLGPAELAQATADLADRFGGTCTVIEGEELLEAGFPTVYTVGKGSARPPCLADLSWGDPDAPAVTLVGKGVVFDSGGLDLKSAAGMKLMKKDMGGAATVLAMAHMIMARELPVRLRVLVPAVENAISGSAYRPLDVIRTRAGLSVEVGNTDAEGRLILCDALAAAAEERPRLLLDVATLTGAARVALGTELPALFANRDPWAEAVLEAGRRLDDPLWRMPLWDAYDELLASDVADLSNVASGSYGGAITAALFLRRFVPKRQDWMHIDTMAWNTSAKPGRPKGGEIFGARALVAAIEARLLAG